MTCSIRTTTTTTTTDETSTTTTSTSSPSTIHKVRTQLTFNGITSSNFESKKPGLKSALSSQTDIAQDKIELTYVSSRRSRRMLNTATVEATFEVEDETAQTSLSNTISHNDFVSNLNTAIASEDSLSSISATQVSTPERFTESNSSDSDDDDNAVMYVIIAVCGVLVVSLLIVFVACPQWP